jgi:hypothetical protein
MVVATITLLAAIALTGVFRAPKRQPLIQIFHDLRPSDSAGDQYAA